jgi:ech hydrogenase subunit A
VIAARQARAAVDTVYLAGAQAGPPESPAFTGPMDQPVVVSAGNYYLPSIFGEERLTFPLNAIAVALIIIMAGGAFV